MAHQGGLVTLSASPQSLTTLLGVVDTVATLAAAIGVAVFAFRIVVLAKRRLLWRVRRKLILSYIFIGVIPALLILVFFLFAGSLVFMNVSAYLFKDGYDTIVENARLSAQAAATEIARNPESAAETIERVHRIRASMYPAISVAYLAPAGGGRETIGPWQGLGPPQAVPGWLKEDAFAASFGVPVKDAPGEEDLIVRALVKVGAGGAGGAVVVDIPLDEEVMHKLHDSSALARPAPRPRRDSAADRCCSRGAWRRSTSSTGRRGSSTAIPWRSPIACGSSTNISRAPSHCSSARCRSRTPSSWSSS